MSIPSSLPELRKAINTLDTELITLLNKRAALSLAVGASKKPTEDIFRPGREAELLRYLEENNPGPLPGEHLRAIYREIFSSSRDLQRPQTVAYLGPEGTFSHLAGLDLLGSLVHFQPKSHLADVFKAVEAGDCDLGIVPLENSLHGSVGVSFDLFSRHKLFIRAETFCRIQHSLVSKEKTLSQIKTIYSHPQALAQCGRWLRDTLPDALVLPTESTGAAAHKALAEPGVGAVAHSNMANTLGLTLLAQGIEDDPVNRTRFVLIGKNPADRPGTNKTSLLFSVNDEPGSLAKVLQCFAEAGVNLHKLESRPMPGEQWKYVFFVDLDCDIHDTAYTPLLNTLGTLCHTVRLLGSYPSGNRLHTGTR